MAIANLFLRRPCGFVYGYALLLLTTTFILPTALTVMPAPTAAAHVQAYGDDRLSPQQLHNIIDALIGSGDFGNWGKIFSTTDPSMFLLSATLFVPGDSGFSSFSADCLSSSYSSSQASDPDPDPEPSVIGIDPLRFSYHIVPQRLSFSDLMLFPINSRLPTLLLDKSVLITNNSLSNFTLNYRSRLSHPDLFSNPTVAVHGIGDALDYANVNNSSKESLDTEAMPQSSGPPRREQEENSAEESLQPPLPDQKKPGVSENPRHDSNVQVALPAQGNGIAKSQASHSVISGSDNRLILCLGWLLGFLIKIQFG